MRCCYLLPACILFIMFTLDCNAQGAAKADNTFLPHWEIGVDLLPLIDKENAPANSLFARCNYYQKGGKGRAWRLRAGVETEIRDFIDIVHWEPSTFRTYAPYVSFGHEWQHVSKGFRWFAAVDGSGSYNKGDFFYLANITDSLQEKVIIKDWTLGATGILGFQVRLFPNIWLSSEAAVAASYWHHHYKNDSYYSGVFSPGNLSEGTDKIFRFQVHPLYVIHLIYSLKKPHHENKKN